MSNCLPERVLLQSPQKQNKDEEHRKDHPYPHRALPAPSLLTTRHKRFVVPFQSLKTSSHCLSGQKDKQEARQLLRKGLSAIQRRSF